MSRSGDDEMSEQLNEASTEVGADAAERRFAPSTDAPPVARKPRTGESIFDVHDVQVYYGEHKAIRDVSMKIDKREITALIGPSGCGKSTFIRCLNRMN